MQEWEQRINAQQQHEEQRINAQHQHEDDMMDKFESQFYMMLQQQTTMMIAQIQKTNNYKNNNRSNRNKNDYNVSASQIQTTSHSKNNTSHSKNNTRSSRHENDYNESASIKSASSNADHATNTESKQANQYKSTTFDTTTTNAELMTQPNQDKENSYHTLVSLGTTRPMPKKYRNPTKSTPTAKRILAADADQHLRANNYPTSTSILAHTRPDPLTTNELVNELRPLSRLRPLRP